MNNRVVIVIPSEMDFLLSKVYRYEVSMCLVITTEKVNINELFYSTIYTTEKLQLLTRGNTTGSVELTSNNYVAETKYLNIQYITKVPTRITVT